MTQLDAHTDQIDHEPTWEHVVMGETTATRRVDGMELLGEYTDDEGVFGDEALHVLNLDGEYPQLQIDELLRAAEVVTNEFSSISGIPVPPFWRQPLTEEEDERNFEIIADRVHEIPDATLEDRLGYIPGVARYYDRVFSSFVDLIDGKRDLPTLFHTDVAKPTQYVFGSLDGGEPQLHFVDLDPEITAIARYVEDGWVIDNHFVKSVTDLAAFAAQHPDQATQASVLALFERMQTEGVLSPAQIEHINYAFARGHVAGHPLEEYRVMPEAA